MMIGKRLYTTIIAMTVVCVMAVAQTFSGPVRYVKTTGSYTNDGTSWDKAKNNLQDAIESLRDYMTRNGITEGRVYVAAGTYYPTTSTPGGDGVLYTSFLIYEGIMVYGGFDATTPEATPEDRIVIGADGTSTMKMSEAQGIKWNLKNTTVLSGNHSSSDADPMTWNAAKNEYDEAFTGNSYHVVSFATNTSTFSSGFDSRNRAVGLANTAGIDGFTVRDGNASNRTVPVVSDGSHVYHNSYGGGVYMVANSEVRNCIVTQNSSALRGGGVYMDGGGLLEHCYVAMNQTAGVGVTDGYGGGVACDDGGVVRHCVIENNVARCGGGLSITFATEHAADAKRFSSYATGVIVNNNTSTAEAGGVFMSNGGMLNHLSIIRNRCVGSNIVYNNRRYARSGGLYADGGGMVTNSVIWGNMVEANNDVQYATYRSSSTVAKTRLDFVALSNYNYVDWSGTVKRTNGVYQLSNDNRSTSVPGWYPDFNSVSSVYGVNVSGAHTSYLVPRFVSFLRHQGMQLNDFSDGSTYATQGSDIIQAHIETDLLGKRFSPRCVLGALVSDSPSGSSVQTTESLEDRMENITTVFVDPNTDATVSPPLDDTTIGGSWDKPFRTINEALDYVKTLNPTAGSPVQILVKEGTATTAGSSYLPHLRSSYVDMPSHVRLYGGFASSLSGTDVSKRNPKAYPTRITANIIGGDYSENGCHIITVRHGVTDVIVDGLQLYFANAVTSSVLPTLALEGGAGIAVVNSYDDRPMENIRIRNCVVANCTASLGSALLLRNTPGAVMQVDVENCIFHNNAVTREQAATVEATGSNTTLTLNHCLIRGNVGYGVMATENANIKVKNTALHANIKYGSYSGSSNPKITDLTATESNPDPPKAVTFYTTSNGSIKLAEGATNANNMMDLGVSDAVATAVATSKFSYLSSNTSTYPKFVNPTSNIGVNKDGDVTLYGGDPNWMPTNTNPMVNAANETGTSATDPSFGMDLTTVLFRNYGGAADIGAVENHNEVAEGDTSNEDVEGGYMPPYGKVIYVRDYRNPDGTIDKTRDGDGSSWQNAINGNLEIDKYKNNHSFGGVDAELYEEGHQLTGLQWAVDEAFARSLERNDDNTIKYSTITGVTHFNPGSQSTVNSDRTTIDVSTVDKSKRVQVWIGEGEYIRREGFFMRDAVDVYGGFPGKGGDPQSPGMKERVPKTSILETLTNEEATAAGEQGVGSYWGPQVDDYAHNVLVAYSSGDVTNLWKVVDFSSDDKQGNAPACIDGNNDTFWHSRWQDDNAGHGIKNGGLPQWIIIDMGQTYEITSLKITNRNYYPNNYTIGYASSYSDDGKAQYVDESAFTLIWDKDITAAKSQTLDFGRTISCQYLYIKVNSNNNSQKHVDILEIEAYNGSTKIDHLLGSRVQNNVYDLNSYAKAYKSQRVLTQPYPYFKGSVQINGKEPGNNLEFDNDPINPFCVITSWDGFVIRNGRTKITHQRDGGAGVALRINGRLVNCVIKNNVLSSGSNTRGAGVFQNGGIIENCEIDGNILNGEGGNVYGGGLYQRTGTVFNTSVINNKITGNGDKQGTGVFFENGRFYNNTITANEGPYTLYSGKWFSNGRIDVYNSIIYNNTTNNTKEFDCTTEKGNITLKNCLFKNKNTHRTFDNSYTNVDASSFVYMDAKGMSASDLFNDADHGDYSLKEGAIAINMGTDQLGKNMEGTADIVLPSYDAQYSDRIQDCTVDIGAYEFNGAYSITPDVTTSADQAVFYVTQNGRGTGSASNPENAACWTKLQKVLDAAGRYMKTNTAGNRVVVRLAGDVPTAEGKYSGFVYRPRRAYKATVYGQEINTRDFTIIVPHGVEVYGGYNDEFTERDILKNRTTLSGVYQAEDQDVNVYNVVTFTNDTYDKDGLVETILTSLDGTAGADALASTAQRSVLDGLFIEGGNADGEKQSTGQRTDTRVGGAAIVTGYAHIRNCVVQNNKATDFGGGLYLEEGALVSGSIVQYNEVTKGDGGGLYVEEPVNVDPDPKAIINYVRIFTSDIIYNKASGAGGGLSFTTDAKPNVRANSVLFWQNTGSEQSNVNGMTTPSDAGNANLTIEDYPISFCATETTREPGINNISVNTDVDRGVRFDTESYNHDYSDAGGNTVTRMHNSHEFYKIMKYSLLARGGMDFDSYRSQVATFALSANDIANVNRLYEGNNFIDIGARAIGELVLPEPTSLNLMTRIFVVKNEDDVALTSVEVMQNQTVDTYYQQEGSSFAYPMRYLDDALEYVRDARKIKDSEGKYQFCDTRFQIVLSGGTYYPMRNIKGEYVNSRGRTYLVPEGVTIVGGVEVKQADGSYYGNSSENKTKTFSHDGDTVVISHADIKDIIKKRRLSDINHNNIAEPWEMAEQTILSGHVVNTNSKENVYHVIACIADENHVGGLPTETKTYTGGGDGTMPLERGVPVIIDGVEIEDGTAMVYDENAVNSKSTYYKGGAICVEGNWTTGDVLRKYTDGSGKAIERPVGYRSIPLEVRNCCFRNNGGNIGGAIFTDSELKVFACNFVQNYAEAKRENVDGSNMFYSGNGGAINASFNTIIVNSLFANNQADTSFPDDGAPGATGVGGAIIVGENGSLHLINCDIVKNLAYGYPAVYCYKPNQGGKYSDGEDVLKANNPHKIVNSIIWGNEVMEYSDSGLDKVINFATDPDNVNKNVEALWFCAYEEGKGNKPVNSTNDIDYRLQKYTGFGTFIPYLWTSKYNYLDNGTATIKESAVNNPDVVAATGLNPVTGNIIIASDNDAINGPNFINPSSKPGVEGFYTSADWMIGRINNLVDNGWTYLQQDLSGIEPTFVYVNDAQEKVDENDEGAKVSGAGIYRRTVYDYENVNTGETAVPIGNDEYMTYADGKGKAMLRISTDPNPTHHQTYIDLGVYEYQHVKLDPTVEDGHVDIIWVTQQERTSASVADGKTWETATSDVQRAIETLLASRNGHDKEIRMLEGHYQPVYTINGNLGFTITTDISTGIVPPDWTGSSTKGINSLTIRGGYSKNVKGLENIHDYPVYLFASERSGVEGSLLGHVFVVGDMRQRESTGYSSLVTTTDVKNYTVPIYLDGLTFCNIKSAPHKDVSNNDCHGGAAVFYKDQKKADNTPADIAYVTEEGEVISSGESTYRQYNIGGTRTDYPLYKLTMNRCDFRINGSTDEVPAVTIGEGGGETLICNSVFHSNLGSPLIATDTKVVNCTFALNGGTLQLKNSQGKSEMHNSVLWRNNGYETTPEWTGLANSADNVVMTHNAISSLASDDGYNNMALSADNNNVLSGTNFFDPKTEITGNTVSDIWQKALRDFRINPSATLIAKASPKKYVELVKDISGRYPYKTRLTGTTGKTDADYEDMVKQDLDLAANTRFYGTAGMERGAYECIASLSRVLYVNPERVSSDDSYNGFTWEKAYTKGNLQAAIDAAAVYSNVNGNKKSYVFVKGMTTSTGETLSMRNHVSLYGSLPSTTVINAGVEQTVHVDGSKSYEDDKIEAFIKAMDSDRDGMASSYSKKHTIVNGVMSTDALDYCLFDGLEIGSGDNSSAYSAASPVVDIQQGNVALRNSIVANNSITATGQPLVNMQSGLLYNVLVRDNTSADITEPLVNIGSGAYVLNTTVAGASGQTLIRGTNSINNIASGANDAAVPFAPYLRHSSVAYHNEIPASDMSNRNLWYQLHERTDNIEGGANDGKSHISPSLQQFVDYTTDRDLLGNPRLIGNKVDNGCFETWSTGTNDSPLTVYADKKDVSYGGHHYPHDGSVVYLQPGGSMVCDVKDGSIPYFDAANPLKPGYLLAMEGGSLFGHGNALQLRYVSAERTVGGQYALVSLPFDMNYRKVDDTMPFVTAVAYDGYNNVVESAVSSVSCYYYDGLARSNYKYSFAESNSECWKPLATDSRAANEGMLMDRGEAATSAKLRFTAYGTTPTTFPYKEGGTDKKVVLQQYDDRESSDGGADFTSVYNMGWNLKGMPYLVSGYATSAEQDDGTLAMKVPHLIYNMKPDGTYTTLQSWMAGCVLSPGDAFFTQTSTLNDEEPLRFSLPRYAAPVKPSPAKRGMVSLVLSKGDVSSSSAVFVPSETSAGDLTYTVNRDGAKFMSMNASMPEVAVCGAGSELMSLVGAAPVETEMSLAVRVPADGLYTFSIDRSDESLATVEAVWLKDYLKGRVVDLLKEDYVVEMNADGEPERTRGIGEDAATCTMKSGRFSVKLGGLRPDGGKTDAGQQWTINVDNRRLTVSGLGADTYVSVCTPDGIVRHGGISYNGIFETDVMPGVYIVRACGNSRKIVCR